MTFGVPPDPQYIAFRNGFMAANDDGTDKQRLRWNPSHAKWFGYPPSRWVLDDPNLADTDPGTSIDLIRDDDPTVERARADMFLPEVFARVQEAHAKYVGRYPNLVWTWREGGSWRSASPRDPVNYPDPEPWVPTSTGDGPWWETAPGDE